MPVERQRALWTLVMVLAFGVAAVSALLLYQRWQAPAPVAGAASVGSEVAVSGEGSGPSGVFALSGGDYAVTLTLQPECSYNLLLVPEDFEQPGQVLGDFSAADTARANLSVPPGEYTVQSTSSPGCRWQADFGQ